MYHHVLCQPLTCPYRLLHIKALRCSCLGDAHRALRGLCSCMSRLPRVQHALIMMEAGVPSTNTPSSSQTNYINSAVYMLCGGFTKMALLTFYLQIVSSVSWYGMPIRIMIGVVVCYTVIIVSMLLFACNPVWMSYSAFPDSTKCLHTPSLYIATGVSNIVSDVILFFLPIAMLFTLNMARAKKIGAFIIFSIGSM